MLPIKTPSDIANLLAERLRERRLSYAWSREELAERSGVNVSSIKRFELTGEISLKRLLILCFTLRALDGFDELLQAPEPLTLSEIEKAYDEKRQRGRRRKRK